MLQDINPKLFINSYKVCTPTDESKILTFKGRDVLMSVDRDRDFTVPTFFDLSKSNIDLDENFIYLFSIDDEPYFWHPEFDVDIKATSYEPILRSSTPFLKDEQFAISVGYQLGTWYETNRYCGRCTHKMEVALDERALYCPQCSNRVYPRINPAIIVAVIDGENILMTKYARGEYTERALIAGFCEIGETLEQTVMREVREETGVCVKDIRYFSSQPWGFASDILMGFIANLDGSSQLKMDKNELCYAEWVNRKDIYEEDDDLSLTRSLIIAFKQGKF